MDELDVRLDFGNHTQHVGVLVQDGRKVFFEFSQGFLDSGLQISPYGFPAAAGLLSHSPTHGVRLPGVFSDSRPDGWGLKLMHRTFQAMGRSASSISPLEELAYLGDHTMGALCYQPSTGPTEWATEAVHLATLATHAQRVYDNAVTDVLPLLVRAGVSSGGARPKALIGLPPNGTGVCSGEGPLPTDWEAWIVKFPTSTDDPDAAERERVWMELAADAGLETPPTQVFDLGELGRAFAVRRFDRSNGKRLHMLSMAGALNVDFRTAVTDYQSLMRLVGTVCSGDQSQVHALFRLAVFNVATVNQDDHLKNFALLMDSTGTWRLSPCFDLTYSPHSSGHRVTSVNGQSQNITRNDLLTVADQVGIPPRVSKQIIDSVLAATEKVESQLLARGCHSPVSATAAKAVLNVTQQLQ